MNGLLPADATLDAKTLSAIKMPNREHVHRRSPARRQESGLREGLLIEVADRANGGSRARATFEPKT